jgi:DeoR/GlpR family transcriptional regulator of sugar metabolism
LYLTKLPGKATFIASVSDFASNAIPNSPLHVATASASTSNHLLDEPINTKSLADEEYPEANESVVGPVT